MANQEITKNIILFVRKAQILYISWGTLWKMRWEKTSFLLLIYFVFNTCDSLEKWKRWSFTKCLWLTSLWDAVEFIFESILFFPLIKKFRKSVDFCLNYNTSKYPAQWGFVLIEQIDNCETSFMFALTSEVWTFNCL